MATTTYPALASAAFIAHVLARAPRTAVFDCDGTLWAPNSGLEFMNWEIGNGFLPAPAAEELLRRYRLYEAGEVSEYDMCAEMVSCHEGLSVEAITAACQRFAQTHIIPFIFPAMQELVHRLQVSGCDVWAVTSTASWVVREGLLPFAIPADRVLGVELAVESGIASGEILAVPTDEHKAHVIERAGVKPDAVFGNSIHDLAMIEIARAAYAVNPNPDLKQIADSRRWVIFQPQV
ncbi:MAG: hypothetical protein NVS9B15_19900 [Acidobacteriaceae bacterium]